MGNDAENSSGRESTPGEPSQLRVCPGGAVVPGAKGIPSQENQRCSEEGPYLACLLSSVTFTLPSTRLRYNLGREQSVRTGTCLWTCPLLCHQHGQGQPPGVSTQSCQAQTLWNPLPRARGWVGEHTPHLPQALGCSPGLPFEHNRCLRVGEGHEQEEK